MHVPGHWIDKVHPRRPLRDLVLDVDSPVSQTYGQQEGSAYDGQFGCTCYHSLFLFNQFGDLERAASPPADGEGEGSHARPAVGVVLLPYPLWRIGRGREQRYVVGPAGVSARRPIPIRSIRDQPGRLAGRVTRQARPRFRLHVGSLPVTSLVPNPPPPGVSMIRTPPRATRHCARPAKRSVAPSARTSVLRPRAPGPPPASPKGE